VAIAVERRVNRKAIEVGRIDRQPENESVCDWVATREDFASLAAPDEDD
jgi:hypothetical protein